MLGAGHEVSEVQGHYDGFSEPLTAHGPRGCPRGTEGWPGAGVMWNTAWEIVAQRDASLEGHSGQLYIPKGEY